MAEEKLPRREREKLRQRQDILATALDLFSQKGYHNVSMHEIAAQAEFAIGTLYKFFPNKEELYKALVLEQCDGFEEAIAQAIEEPEDEVEKLRCFIRAKSARFQSHLPFVRLFLAESRGASFNLKAGLNEEMRIRYYNFLEKVAGIFAQGISNRRFKNIADPYYLAAVLDSILDTSLLLWLDLPERFPFPENPDRILDFFFEGLMEA
ncbi:MAG: TetR/AcrR family transcriptional regulator [Desulfobaccales bacterium]